LFLKLTGFIGQNNHVCNTLVVIIILLFIIDCCNAPMSMFVIGALEMHDDTQFSHIYYHDGTLLWLHRHKFSSHIH